MSSCYRKLKAIGLISLFVLTDNLLVTEAHQHRLLTYPRGYASSQKGPQLSKCEPLGDGKKWWRKYGHPVMLESYLGILED